MAVDAQQRVLLEEALQQQAALHASSTQVCRQQASWNLQEALLVGLCLCECCDTLTCSLACVGGL